MSITMIGLDTAKSVFQIHSVNEAAKAKIKRKLRKSELIPFLEKQGTCIPGFPNELPSGPPGGRIFG